MDLNYRPDFLNAGGYNNTVGRVDSQFDWIGRQTLRGIPMTAIHTPTPHGLKVGQRIHIEVDSGSWGGSGTYDVQAIADVDDGSYNGYLLVIHQNMAAGQTASGRVRTMDITAPLTAYKENPPVISSEACPEGYVKKNENCIKIVVENCPAGKVKIGGVCVTPDPGSDPGNSSDGCPQGSVMMSGVCTKIDQASVIGNLPAWAKYVALAGAAGIVLWMIFKRNK